MRKILLTAIAALSLTTGIARAEQYPIVGAGISTCAKFTELSRTELSRSDPTFYDWDNAFYTWAEGFMSGLNSVALSEGRAGRDLNSIPWELQQQMLRHYCNNHPLDGYITAIMNIYNKLDTMGEDAATPQRRPKD